MLYVFDIVHQDETLINYKLKQNTVFDLITAHTPISASACKKISLHGHLRKIIRLDCFHVLLL